MALFASLAPVVWSLNRSLGRNHFLSVNFRLALDDPSQALLGQFAFELQRRQDSGRRSIRDGGSGWLGTESQVRFPGGSVLVPGYLYLLLVLRL